MPLEEYFQPLSGVRDGIVHSFAQLHLHRPKLCHHSLLDRFAPNYERPVPFRSRAEMREAEKVERLWLPLPSLFAVSGRVAAKADQPGLGWMQRQLELAQTFLQVLQERPGLVLVLKAGDEIVRVADDDHVATCLPAPAVDPQIKRVVQISVGKRW